MKLNDFVLSPDCLELNKHLFTKKKYKKMENKKYDSVDFDSATDSFIINIYETPISQNIFKTFHHTKQSRIKKQWEKKIIDLYLTLSQAHKIFIIRRLKKVIPEVVITFYFDNDVRHDKDNYVYFKALGDGLTKAKFIIDDNSKQAKFIYPDLVLKYKTRKAEIIIKYKLEV